MEAVEEKGSLSVYTENLFPIIKKWLYGERDIFLRELISNAHDAIYKLDRLSDLGEYKGEVPEGRIEILIDKNAKTIKISDNGLGMTADEVRQYINQIAFSGAEEFIQKYEKEGRDQEIIGHFGLGFFSAFMVADDIEIVTRSYRFADDKKAAVHWRCTGTTDFTLSSGERESVGTDVILHLSDDSKDLLDEAKIKELIVRFSDFLPVIIELNGKKVNHQKPLWQRSPAELKDEDYRNFYKHLFPNQGEPLFYVHLSIDFPFQVKGILYFPRIRVDMDITKGGRIKLFCNNVFVSDNIVDIIPQYLNMLQGVLDSPDIPLNVSRSMLQSDGRVRKLSGHIVKKLAAKLVSLAKNKREEYEGYWKDVHPFVKFAAMNDNDFYDKAKDAILFTTLADAEVLAKTEEKETEVAQTQTAEGETKASKEAVGQGEKPSAAVTGTLKMTTLSDYQKRNTMLKDKVLYASHLEEEHRAIAEVKALGGEIILLDSPIDAHFIQYLEGKLAPLQFLRVDSAPASELMAGDGGETKDQALDEDGEKKYLQFFKECLGLGEQTVQLKTLAANAGPSLITVNEHMRRFQEMSSMMNSTLAEGAPGLLGKTLVLNRSHPLVEQTRSWYRKHSVGASKDSLTVNAEKDGVKALLQNIHDLALLRSGQLKGKALETFTNRVTDLFAKNGESLVVGKTTREASIGTKSIGTKSTGTKSIGTKSIGTKSIGTKSTGTKSTGTKSIGTKSIGTKSIGTKSIGTKSIGTKSTGTKSIGTKSTGKKAT